MFLRDSIGHVHFVLYLGTLLMVTQIRSNFLFITCKVKVKDSKTTLKIKKYRIPYVSLPS